MEESHSPSQDGEYTTSRLSPNGPPPGTVFIVLSQFSSCRKFTLLTHTGNGNNADLPHPPLLPLQVRLGHHFQNRAILRHWPRRHPQHHLQCEISKLSPRPVEGQEIEAVLGVENNVRRPLSFSYPPEFESRSGPEARSLPPDLPGPKKTAIALRLIVDVELTMKQIFAPQCHPRRHHRVQALWGLLLVT